MSNPKIWLTEIKDVRPHSNADALDLALVQGWQMVVKKDAFKSGDTVIYFEQGLVLPPETADLLGVANYLSTKTDIDGNKVGVIHRVKLRGEPSFGLVIPADLPTDLSTLTQGVVKFNPPAKNQAGDALPNHPMFPNYTDIENLRTYSSVLQEGELVVVSEKLHGCLRSSTRIRMADSSSKAIKDIVVGDEVMGVDEFGKVTSTVVTNIFDNGPTEEWVELSGKRNGLGRGYHEWKIVATPNHQFYIPERGYVPVSQLRTGDKVVMIRNEIGLTPVQEQILIGKMLGDGSLATRPSANSPSTSITFGQKDEEYSKWLRKALGSLMAESEGIAVSGYGTKMYRSATTWRWGITNLFEDWIDENGKKVVPLSVVDKATPLSLAFWYMDDGSLVHHDDQEDRAMFATCGFSREDCEVLLKTLAKYGVVGIIYEAEGYYRIRLNADDAERFFLLIAPYIPPSMQYKLPERYRGGSGWIPDCGKGEYKPLLREQTIESITPYQMNGKANKSRYDIETGTHNFFASDVLVHNSSGRVGFVRNSDGTVELLAGSRQWQRKRPERLEDSTYWFPHTLESVKGLLNLLEVVGHQQAVLYGEVYGMGIQSYQYNEKRKMFRAFDLMLDGQFVDYEFFKYYCNSFNVPMVPIDYTGPYSLDKVRELSEAPSQLGNPQGREGVVVKPVVERNDPVVGRAILKYVADSYLFGKAAQQDTTDL